MSYQREFDRYLEIGVVGVGSHCYRNLLPAMNYLPVRLRAMCDVEEPRLQKTARQFGVEATYTDSAAMYANEELDAVFIAVGPGQHPALACQALDAGVPVWLEKPPAVRAEGVSRMIAHRDGLPVVVGFKKAFMPALTKAHEIVNREESGPLLSILGQYSMSIPENGARILDDGSVTNWLANGCHPLSAMMAVGGPVGSVVTHRGERGGGAVILHFEDGAVGNLHLAAGMRGPCENYAFFTENAHVVIENGLRVTHHRGTPSRYGVTTTYAPEGEGHGSVVWEPQNTYATLENKALFTQGMYQEMRHFCDCVLEGTSPTQGTLEFALDIMKVYEAALLSDGHPVATADIPVR